MSDGKRLILERHEMGMFLANRFPFDGIVSAILRFMFQITDSLEHLHSIDSSRSLPAKYCFPNNCCQRFRAPPRNVYAVRSLLWQMYFFQLPVCHAGNLPDSIESIYTKSPCVVMLRPVYRPFSRAFAICRIRLQYSSVYVQVFIHISTRFQSLEPQNQYIDGERLRSTNFS